MALGLTLGSGLTSCEKQLDLDPYQSVDAATALNTQDKVGSAVIGLYSQLDDPSLYGTDLILVPELLGADNYITFQGTFTNYRQLTARTTNALNSSAEAIWREAYQEINQTNLVIDALPVVTDPTLKATYEGEARFVRALMYYNLVNLYAQQYVAGGTNTQLGVPISLVPVKSLQEASVLGTRATVAQVYSQILTDLTQAAQLLPTANGVRATRYTAQALQARVYLQQGNYTAAATAANSVIANSRKALSPTLQAVFTNRNSSETLLEIQQNEQNNAGTSNSGLATLFASIGQLGRGDVAVQSTFANQYSTADARGRAQLLYVGTGARAGSLRSGKWTTYGQNIPVIRLAEMYLIRAEAALQAGNRSSALADVNIVRQRSSATPLTDAELTQQAILRERQLELAFEGFRIYDLKRTNTDLVRTVTDEDGNPRNVVTPITNNLLTLPIPQREINVNAQLVQNPGYGG
ncbi:RagB/SusD family nutrient uptake outer membrane protein [Hymenobacter aerilatus]|uniref:RagB/SusD family nutrient uptake outer membrane protein n=1 Tax=Hymenobacter aerilatus TaxID=2932251 RepID=A0A8T9SZP6_9BACT|nr:RagB/SusD family nutrient uptake outer membrane protein [Hymenobacter aerilatus]UOR05710.1 RagB/SusD family nutrient uptake outer membrane protein [Hymenobacter aerilatus]